MMIFTVSLLFCLLVSPLVANEADFAALYNKWYPKCSAQHVALQDDGSDYLTSNIPWSLNSSTIHDFVRGNGGPYCSSVDQMMESVTHPIVKYPCRVSWLSLEEICQLIQSHSFIIWSGDSMIRHQTQALFLLLKQDLMFGSFPPRPKGVIYPYSRCQCDGQFSESKMCRAFTRNYNEFFSFTDINKHTNLCGGLKSQEPTKFVMDSHNEAVKPDNGRSFFSSNGTGGRCSSDPRPVFFLVEGGAHYHTDSNLFIEEYLQPYLRNIYTSAGHCKSTAGVQYKINVVVSGVVTSRARVVERFKHQSDEHAVKFYAAVQRFLQSNYPQVKLLNFLSLTAEGVNYSDGLHSFTDVNLIKTMIVLNAMKMML